VVVCVRVSHPEGVRKIEDRHHQRCQQGAAQTEEKRPHDDGDVVQAAKHVVQPLVLHRCPEMATVTASTGNQMKRSARPEIVHASFKPATHALPLAGISNFCMR